VTVQDPHAGVEQSIVDAAAALAGARDIALACHVNPDGDALGSMLGLFHVLRASGRAVVASFPSPFVVAPHYRELPGLDLLTAPGDFPTEPDVMVTFDCGSSGRLGDLEPAAKAARELVVLDHHVSNTRFGTINVIDPAAAASGVLVRRLLLELGLPLTNDAAVSLYAALVCDTGRFQYDTTSPSVFDLARELVSFDVPVSRLSRQLFEEHRFAYLKVLGEALAAAELDEPRRFVATIVTREMLDRHGVELEELEGLIDILRRATEAEITCVIKEDVDGEVRVSLRSLGALDVRDIAVANGGGGHRFAAGFESHDPAVEVLERIREAIPVTTPGPTPGATPA
jgi:phosphoesterase RecJ-like protein